MGGERTTESPVVQTASSYRVLEPRRAPGGRVPSGFSRGGGGLGSPAESGYPAPVKPPASNFSRAGRSKVQSARVKSKTFFFLKMKISKRRGYFFVFVFSSGKMSYCEFF